MKLQKIFLPKFKTLLIRLGKDNDGGYCVPKKSVMNSDFLFSFGPNDDWSFEKDFINKNSKTRKAKERYGYNRWVPYHRGFLQNQRIP